MSKASLETSESPLALTEPASVAVIARGDRGEAIAQILVEAGREIASFERVEGLLGRDDQTSPGAIVLWVGDKFSSTSEFIEPLARRFEHAPVVVVCSTIQRWEVRMALLAGAAGIVLSDDLDLTLDPCLRAVRAGQICVPRAHWRQVEPPALSAREKQILGLVVMGYMNSEIAERLFLAESTVKSHLSSAFGKLGVRSRNEAANLILDPERGLGMGILGLGGESIEVLTSPSR
jgi:DNA-binding NarL/FixJ family response regulator